MRQLNFLLLIITWTCSHAQVNSEYLFTHEIDSIFEASSDPRMYQHYAVNYANIGAHERVLYSDYAFVTQYQDYNPSKHELDDSFLNYRATEALPYILEKARNHQIVMINESHNSAQNRRFTESLIIGLKEQGFQHFYVEDLTHDASIIEKMNAQKYPVMDGGYYLKEPAYGSLIRTSLEQGYKIYNYDCFPPDSIQDPMDRWAFREQGQADNILKTLEKDPNAKIIVHCGYGHLGERLLEENLGMMGALVKEKSGLDPLTINQVFMLETYSVNEYNPYRSHIDPLKLKSSSVFINDKNEVFSADPENYDINVYFPPTRYYHGRPEWLLTDRRESYLLSELDLNLPYPYLVMAYADEEDSETAVPIDIIEINQKYDRKGLILKKGSYYIHAVSANGQKEVHNIHIR